MKKPILVVMAAGLGSRYGSLKQMVSVGGSGHTLMEYSLYDAKRAGFSRVVFVIGESMVEFGENIRARVGAAFETQCVIQRLSDLPAGFHAPDGRKKPWGTGHAIRACRDVIDAPFAAINADDYYGRESFQALYRFLEGAAGTEGEYAMVGYRLMNTLSLTGHVARGICEVDGEGYLTDIHERTRIVYSSDGPLFRAEDGRYTLLSRDAIASMNFWGFSPDFMRQLDERFSRFLCDVLPGSPEKAEYFLPEVVGAMLRDGEARVSVLPTEATWYGMTYQEDLPVVTDALDRMTAEGEYPERLW